MLSQMSDADGKLKQRRADILLLANPFEQLHLETAKRVNSRTATHSWLSGGWKTVHQLCLSSPPTVATESEACVCDESASSCECLMCNSDRDYRHCTHAKMR
jgi:hypothetical protein